MTRYAELLRRMTRLLRIIIVGQILASVFAQNTSHSVMRGETIYSIARQYSVSVESLVKANEITDPSNVRVGTLLVIPAQTASVSPLAVGYHTVMSGETYFGIARKYNISVETLLALNERTSNTVLRVNEQLTVAALPSQPSPPQTSSPTPPVISPPVPNPITEQPVALITSGTVSWPVSGGEMRLHTGKQGGVQIHTSGESRVQSVASGVVVYVGSFRELGNLVLVEKPGGYIYIYGGLNMVLVKQGETVHPGTALGVLSGGGNPLVFSVFKDSNLMNPQNAPRD